ncbi:PREDICTED: homocysteine S-methyltransferase 1-like [Nanorana parkeri]|uniref:homocysteine S-methyltransferase 1-like n=1 Tax=Nanorana parkeri TaxID=125878 RepID=UPI000854FBE9|nr:PREDICTED: homocysteine S-methyltransferase 1-like [Nanorana parkeri]
MAERVRILSGGLSTELEAAGFIIQGDPLWSARLLHTYPQAIKDAHTSFLKSGSEVLSTATYQASIEGFVQHLGVTVDGAAELFNVAVSLAREAAEEFNTQSSEKRNILIAGSIGPYGAFLHDGSEYTGTYVRDMSIEELKNWHRVQMQCLASAGVDLFAMETIPSQKEAEALVQVLREFPNSKAWLSYSCQDISSTSYGDKFEEAVKVSAATPQLVAVGVNCCSPDFISPLLSSANKNCNNLQMDWIVYPNSGEKWDHNLGWRSSSIEKPLSEHALEWFQLGARWIGGCCQSTPAEIESLRKILETRVPTMQ